MGSDLLCERPENQTVKTMKPSVWYIEYRLKPGITWWPLDSCGPFEVEAEAKNLCYRLTADDVEYRIVEYRRIDPQ